jgi:hypothetical protein
MDHITAVLATSGDGVTRYRLVPYGTKLRITLNDICHTVLPSRIKMTAIVVLVDPLQTMTVSCVTYHGGCGTKILFVQFAVPLPSQR